MLAQAPTSLRRPLLVILLAVAVLAAPAVSGAVRAPSTTSLHAQDAVIESKSRAAILELYSLDQKLAAAQTRLADLRLQLDELRGERTTLRHALVIARHSNTVAQRNLAHRLQLLYEQGEVEPLEILFGARSLDEALTSIDNLKGVTKQDGVVLLEVQHARATFTRSAQRLSTRLAALELATAQAESTTRSLASTRAQRQSYLASLAEQRRMNQTQISSLVSRAQAAQQRSAELTAPRNATGAAVFTTATAPSSFASGRTLTVEATGYALGGRTASGLSTGWGIVAVDPSVIPLGTHMSVPGYGEAVAADTGSAVIGNVIDLWFPTVAQANAWGRRVVTITIH